MEVQRGTAGSEPGLPDALHAPLLLLLWFVSIAEGACLGLWLEIQVILDLREHPVVAACLPVVFLTTVAIGVWRHRRLRQWLRLAAVGAVLGALVTGPTFLLGLQALGTF